MDQDSGAGAASTPLPVLNQHPRRWRVRSSWGAERPQQRGVDLRHEKPSDEGSTIGHHDGMESKPMPGEFAHLLVKTDGLCWWCRSAKADTGEHKFKRASLARLMGDGPALIWGDGTSVRELRGKAGITRDRYRVVKFPKSMCAACNNSRSQPFDIAYDTYEEFVSGHLLRLMPGIGLGPLYGPSWQADSLNLARYHAKHFGCRMVRAGLPVPQSLRDFLNGDSDMPDAHMAIVTTDEVNRVYGNGLYMGPDFVYVDVDSTRFTAFVMAAYIGSIGVRYEWREEGIPEEERSQFFHYAQPVINTFRTELDMAMGRPRKPGWFARLTQWASTPVR
ncbi:hypothetical protein NJL88_27720 [Streptomyces sp. DK15]|uniref:hypothetical protein n=1 Tax=Streptomyces sp. DK15 TaxID=2957499 RepID=UPI0029AB1AC5|nr:hypothetical protein [Streptomyces sp. DK15]MDX2393782.1 hypothetical protein [Streptomyces sp. DK15]